MQRIPTPPVPHVIVTYRSEVYVSGGGKNFGVDTTPVRTNEAEAMGELFNPDKYAIAFSVVLVRSNTELPLAITIPLVFDGSEPSVV